MEIRPLNPYVGPLTSSEIAAGISAAQTNALRLLDDAKFLLESGRYETATELSILSMEERGKVIILKRLALTTDPKEIKKVWKQYRNHKDKNAGSILPILIANGAKHLSEMSQAVDSQSEHTSIIDSVKQISFYSDCFGKRHWSIPSEVIDEGLARSMYQLATMMYGNRPITQREIELWTNIVGPHYNSPSMIDSIIQFQHEMHREGLSQTTSHDLYDFMRG